jgi:hypothetical protein
VAEGIGGEAGQEDVSSAATTHYSLGLVDASSGDVTGAIDVLYEKHWSAVDAHADLAEGVFSKSTSDVDSARRGLFRRAEEHQRHAVAGRQGNQIVRGAGPLELAGRLNELLEASDHLGLLVGGQARTAHDVHEEHVSHNGFGGGACGATAAGRGRRIGRLVISRGAHLDSSGG